MTSFQDEKKIVVEILCQQEQIHDYNKNNNYFICIFQLSEFIILNLKNVFGEEQSQNANKRGQNSRVFCYVSLIFMQWLVLLNVNFCLLIL